MNSDNHNTPHAERRVRTIELTPPKHQNIEGIVLAALWLLRERQPGIPVIPYIRDAFGLTSLEACQAAALSSQMRLKGEIVL